MQIFKQSALLLIGLLLLAITSCKKEMSTTIESSKNTAATVMINSNDASITYKLKQTIDLTGGSLALSNCINEELLIKSGVINLTTVVVQNTHAYSFTEHLNTSNFKVIEPLTGIEYTGSEESTFNRSFPTFNPLLAQTTTLSIVLTTPGYGNNIYLKGDWHITIDATGKVTSWVDNFRADCNT